MNSQPRKISKPTCEKTVDLIRLAAESVDHAQGESREMGVPNVYSVNGQIYRESSKGLVPDTPETAYRQTTMR